VNKSTVYQKKDGNNKDAIKRDNHE